MNYLFLSRNSACSDLVKYYYDTVYKIYSMLDTYSEFGMKHFLEC